MADRSGPVVFIARNVLWVDCVAAALAGTAVLALSGWLSRLHLLPQELLLVVGFVNLLYASYSFTLARRAVRPLGLIKLLVFANATWVVVCLALATTFWGRASVFGIAHLVGEAIFVAALAAMEWSQRYRLVAAAGARAARSEERPRVRAPLRR